VDRAVDIAILFLIVCHQPVDHLAGFLGRSRVVEIYQGFAVHQDIQYWKIVTDMYYVKTHRNQIKMMRQN